MYDSVHVCLYNAADGMMLAVISEASPPMAEVVLALAICARRPALGQIRDAGDGQRGGTRWGKGVASQRQGRQGGGMGKERSDSGNTSLHQDPIPVPSSAVPSLIFLGSTPAKWLVQLWVGLLGQWRLPTRCIQHCLPLQEAVPTLWALVHLGWWWGLIWI